MLVLDNNLHSLKSLGLKEKYYWLKPLAKEQTFSIIAHSVHIMGSTARPRWAWLLEYHSRWLVYEAKRPLTWHMTYTCTILVPDNDNYIHAHMNYKSDLNVMVIVTSVFSYHGRVAKLWPSVIDQLTSWAEMSHKLLAAVDMFILRNYACPWKLWFGWPWVLGFSCRSVVDEKACEFQRSCMYRQREWKLKWARPRTLVACLPSVHIISYTV